MYRFYTLLFIVFFLFNHKGYCQKERIENTLYRCFDIIPASKKDSLNNLTLEFENYLVDHQILKSTDGEGYRAIIKAIYKNPDTLFYNDFDFILKFSKIVGIKNVLIKHCLDTVLASDKYDRTKMDKLHSLFEQINYNNLQVKPIAEKILTVFTDDDFELVYNKFEILLLVDAFSIPASTRLENLDQMVILPNDKPIEVFLNKSVLTVDGKNSTISEMKNLILKRLEKYQSNTYVILGSTRDTTYRDYMDVQNAIVEVYNKLKDSYSNKEFGKSFNELTKEQQEQVKIAIPQRILEKGPE